MKKILTICLSIASIITFASSVVVKDNDLKNNALNAVNETNEVNIDQVVGTKTSTTHTVDFYYNQVGDGICRRYYVEDGQKIESFRKVFSGWRFFGWFYDQVGTIPFDFENTEIKDDMVLYAYHRPNSGKVEVGVTPYEEDTNGSKVTWTPGAGSSFMNTEGGLLPSYAEEGDVISFYLQYGYGAEEEAVVTANGNELTHTEGVYSYTMTSEAVTFASTSVEVIETESTPVPKYYLVINGNVDDKVKFVGHNETEVKLQGIEMKKGDTFYVVDPMGTEYAKLKNPVYANGFTAPWDGLYDFYFDFNNFYTWVEIPGDPNAGSITIYFSNSKHWETPYYYAWGKSGNVAGWPGSPMTWVEKNDYNEDIYKVDIDVSTYTNIIFHDNNGTQTIDISLVGVTSGTGFYVTDGDGKLGYGTYQYSN